jgi:hypothetical protein
MEIPVLYSAVQLGQRDRFVALRWGLRSPVRATAPLPTPGFIPNNLYRII